MSKKLTLKQKKFCEYYAQLGNAAESARKAGYSKKTAEAIGLENLGKPRLQKYIKELTAENQSKRIQSIIEGQEWLTDILEGRVVEKEIIITKEGKTIEIKKTPKLDTLLKAREQLNKMQGAYLDRVEIQAKVDISGEYKQLSLEELKRLANEDHT